MVLLYRLPAQVMTVFRSSPRKRGPRAARSWFAATGFPHSREGAEFGARFLTLLALSGRER